MLQLKVHYIILAICYCCHANYNFVLEHIKIGDDVDNISVKNYSLKNVMVNRRTRGFDLYAEIKEINRKWTFTILPYQKRNNDYKLFAPLKSKWNICNVIKTGVLNRADGNFKEQTCPMKDVTVHFKNFVVNPEKLPKNIPEGSYKLVITLNNGIKDIGSGEACFTITNKVLNRK